MQLVRTHLCPYSPGDAGRAEEYDLGLSCLPDEVCGLGGGLPKNPAIVITTRNHINTCWQEARLTRTRVTGSRKREPVGQAIEAKPCTGGTMNKVVPHLPGDAERPPEYDRELSCLSEELSDLAGALPKKPVCQPISHDQCSRHAIQNVQTWK